MRLLVAGGCGFTGSNFIRYVLEHYQPESITNVDALTDPAALPTTADLPDLYRERYEFVHADIGEPKKIDELLSRHSYFGIINFASEHGLDQSVTGWQSLIHTNVAGAAALLETARRHGVKRFLQVSTDEVYGSIDHGRFSEESRLQPSSPFAASKAAADLFALASHRTYRQDVLVARCSNSFGPGQSPKEFIPAVIARAVSDKPVPLSSEGRTIRDWMHVSDHCAALFTVFMEGHSGQIYNIGTGSERTSLSVVEQILRYLGKAADLIEYSDDRPGDDRRRAIDPSKLRSETGWHPLREFDQALEETVRQGRWTRENQGPAPGLPSGAPPRSEARPR